MSSSEKVALKIVKQEKFQRAAIAEYSVVKSLQHQNIVAMLGWFVCIPWAF